MAQGNPFWENMCAMCPLLEEDWYVIERQFQIILAVRWWKKKLDTISYQTFHWISNCKISNDKIYYFKTNRIARWYKRLQKEFIFHWGYSQRMKYQRRQVHHIIRKQPIRLHILFLLSLSCFVKKMFSKDPQVMHLKWVDFFVPCYTKN